MAILLREIEPGDTPFTPLVWYRLTGAADSLLATCAKGHTANLSDHSVAQDGIVTPSVVCPTEGCHWHENVQLEGWD